MRKLLSTHPVLIVKLPSYPLSLGLYAPLYYKTFVGITLTGHQQTDLCYSDEVGDDSCPLWGSWLAEHHELDPLRDAVEEGDETLQDGVVHSAAVHHKAVVVLKLNEGGSR